MRITMRFPGALWATGVLIMGALLLAGCGGSSSKTSTTPTAYTVGGTVTGLTGTLVLSLNGGNNATMTGDGTFTFGTTLSNGSTYTVAIVTQPSGQTCAVANASGTIAGANVTNVAVTCTTPPADVNPNAPSAIETMMRALVLVTDNSSVLPLVHASFLDQGDTYANLFTFPGPGTFAAATSGATPITVGTVGVTANWPASATPGAYIAYSFTADGSRYRVGLTDTNGECDFTLYTSAGVEWMNGCNGSFDDATGESYVVVQPAAGTMYLLMQQNVGSPSTSYTVKVQTVDNTNALSTLFGGTYVNNSARCVSTATTDVYHCGIQITSSMGTFSTYGGPGFPPLIVDTVTNTAKFYGNQRQHSAFFRIEVEKSRFQTTSAPDPTTTTTVSVDMDEVRGRDLTGVTLGFTGAIAAYNSADALQTSPVTLSNDGYGRFSWPGSLKSSSITDLTSTLTINATTSGGTLSQDVTIPAAPPSSAGTVTVTGSGSTATLSWSDWETTGMVAHEQFVNVSDTSGGNANFSFDLSASGTLTTTLSSGTISSFGGAKTLSSFVKESLGNSVMKSFNSAGGTGGTTTLRAAGGKSGVAARPRPPGPWGRR
ncbi:MAG: hypothetical protein HY423_08955 [Candidatus Lambdaproteobacteria bacterium]|nr:hypothetical protein [Candidatus Lambdaproteobacteria bacterium]